MSLETIVKSLVSFADRTDSNFKSLDVKYGEISAKLTQILDELRTENREALNQLKDATRALVEAVNNLKTNR